MHVVLLQADRNGRHSAAQERFSGSQPQQRQTAEMSFLHHAHACQGVREQAQRRAMHRSRSEASSPVVHKPSFSHRQPPRR